MCYITECFSLVHKIELYVNRMEENKLNEKGLSCSDYIQWQNSLLNTMYNFSIATRNIPWILYSIVITVKDFYYRIALHQQVWYTNWVKPITNRVSVSDTPKINQ